MPLKLKRNVRKSPNWYLRGTVRGVYVEESTGTSDKAAAEEIRIKRETEILERSIHGRSATATFLEAAVSYMEAGGEKRFLKPIIYHFGTTPLARIGQAEIDAAAVSLFPKAQPSTRNRQFYTPVSAVLKHGAKRKMCEAWKIERPKLPPGRVRWITPEEAERLIEVAPLHLRRIIVFILYTGARVGEALAVDWREVDLARRHVQFPRTKNGEPRGVPLHPRVVAMLREINDRDGVVLRRDDGEPYAAKEDSGGHFKSAWRTACRKAGITDFRPHDLRHTWATWTYQRTPDLIRLQSLGGWKSVAMVTRYAHVDSSTHRGAIDALPWGISGESEFPEAETERKSA